MKFLHYPGCSLQGTGRAYDESLRAVYEVLNCEIEELEDWNCCGATAYMAIDEEKAFALAARNLALAERQGGTADEPVQLVAPCSACYLVLAKAKRYMDEYREVGETISGALREAGLVYSGQAEVRHPLDLFTNDIGLPVIAGHVTRSLSGLKVACYYGCQIVRPYATFDDQQDPMVMDHLIRTLGADTTDWRMKTRCCGGALTGTIPEVGLRLNHILLREAKRRGADVIATACPLCQFNLECFQKQIAARENEDITIPVVYFTQLMGLAFGIEESRLAMNRLFTPLSLPVRKAREVAHVAL